MSFINEFLVRKKESLKLFTMDLIFCPDDRFGVRKNTASCVLSASLLFFVPQNNLLLQRAGKNFRSQFFIN